MIFENIDDFLDKNNDHLVSFTVSTYNNINLIRNLLNSALQNNIKLVFFALDKEIADFIHKNFNSSVTIVLYDVDVSNKSKNSDSSSSLTIYKYGSQEWASIVYYRYFICHRLLKDGRNIVYMDTDVFINRNYLIDIKEKLRVNDIVIQSNGNDCCTGFFAMKSNRKLINFFNKKNMINNLKCYEFGGNGGPSDQKFFNHYIGKNMNDFNCVLLERNFYPNGNYFYENSELINDYCFIIHFNCLKGEYKKIKKIIEFDKLVVKLIDYLPNDEETLAQKDISEYKNLLDSISIYDDSESMECDFNNEDEKEFNEKGNENKNTNIHLMNQFEIDDNIIDNEENNIIDNEENNIIDNEENNDFQININLTKEK